ncbi:uncharacterized protein V6R79_005881 [Siganus canaliculatus]
MDKHSGHTLLSTRVCCRDVTRVDAARQLGVSGMLRRHDNRASSLKDASRHRDSPARRSRSSFLGGIFKATARSEEVFLHNDAQRCKD